MCSACAQYYSLTPKTNQIKFIRTSLSWKVLKPARFDERSLKLVFGGKNTHTLSTPKAYHTGPEAESKWVCTS